MRLCRGPVDVDKPRGVTEAYIWDSPRRRREVRAPIAARMPSGLRLLTASGKEAGRARWRTALRPRQRPETVSDSEDCFDVVVCVYPEFFPEPTDAGIDLAFANLR
jgi:hypothetical protein